MEGNLGMFSYDPAKAREYHALYLASTQHLLNLGEDPAFEEYIRRAYNLKFRHVSRNTTRNDTIRLFNDMRNRLIQEFGSFHMSVACTSDI